VNVTETAEKKAEEEGEWAQKSKVRRKSLMVYENEKLS
jgi:hypothetical protein